MTNDVVSDGGKSKNFANIALLENWLAEYHNIETELWVRVFNKKSGVISVSWDDCVVAVLRDDVLLWCKTALKKQP
ncbi:hypothetical protein [Falsihalocynthiibacter arcticus]|uniref:Uncharacterized protein n=1 Tax=Falsihalocynthiibacter arcticus TaxID=1579316 RepID=A0A126V1B1_9RHOB|nr:hypothetical protein [Falsihalocynthiibacter arcticus]AML51725.1 hypothetical protein RC74_11035 [Falsihalocynthiibacter arcticus]